MNLETYMILEDIQYSAAWLAFISILENEVCIWVHNNTLTFSGRSYNIVGDHMSTVLSSFILLGPGHNDSVVPRFCDRRFTVVACACFTKTA